MHLFQNVKKNFAWVMLTTVTLLVPLVGSRAWLQLDFGATVHLPSAAKIITTICPACYRNSICATNGSEQARFVH